MALPKPFRSEDARTRLDLVSPPLPTAGELTLLVPPSHAGAPLVQAAFVVLLRFELRRRLPHAVSRPWPAEDVPARLRELAPHLVAPAEDALERAKTAVASHIAGGAPSPDALLTMARHALRVARLDAVVVAGYVDERIAEPEDDEAARDLVAMLDVVPWAELGGASSADLAPPLGELSGADLLLDGRLLAVRTRKSARVERDDVRGLMVDVLLSRAARAADATLDEARAIGVYAARHAKLWTADVAPLVARDAFPRVELWFGDELRGKRARVPRWAKTRGAPQWGSSTRYVPPAEKAKPPPAPAKTAKPAKPAKAAKPRAADEPAEAPRRGGAARPDWRKGSAWRRARGK